MACSYSTTQWCGTSSCRNDALDTGTDMDGVDLIGCNPGYTFTGWEKFKRTWPMADQYLRICTRNISGTPLQCASGQRDSMVCPNDYCKHTSPASISYMIDYCKIGDRIFEDYDCKKWGGYQQAAFKGVLKNKCNNVTNLKNPQCQEFCRSNPGQCPTVIDFCSIHPTDPLCSCLKSPLNTITGEGAPPVSCFDNNCIETGYHSTSMERVSKNCPAYINCKMIINAQQGAVLNNVNIQQKCAIEIAKDQTERQSAEAAAMRATADREAARRAKELADAQTAQRDKARAKYLADTPTWKQKYDSVVSVGIGKKVADTINSAVPNTGVVIGGVEVDEVKPLLVLLIMIIVLVLLSTSDELGSGDYVPGAYGPEFY